MDKQLTLRIELGNKAISCPVNGISPKTLRRFCIGTLEYLEYFNFNDHSIQVTLDERGFDD